MTVSHKIIALQLSHLTPCLESVSLSFFGKINSEFMAHLNETNVLLFLDFFNEDYLRELCRDSQQCNYLANIEHGSLFRAKVFGFFSESLRKSFLALPASEGALFVSCFLDRYFFFYQAGFSLMDADLRTFLLEPIKKSPQLSHTSSGAVGLYDVFDSTFSGNSLVYPFDDMVSFWDAFLSDQTSFLFHLMPYLQSSSSSSSFSSDFYFSHVNPIYQAYQSYCKSFDMEMSLPILFLSETLLGIIHGSQPDCLGSSCVFTLSQLSNSDSYPELSFESRFDFIAPFLDFSNLGFFSAFTIPDGAYGFKFEGDKKEQIYSLYPSSSMYAVSTFIGDESRSLAIMSQKWVLHSKSGVSIGLKMPISNATLEGFLSLPSLCFVFYSSVNFVPMPSAFRDPLLPDVDIYMTQASSVAPFFSLKISEHQLRTVFFGCVSKPFNTPVFLGIPDGDYAYCGRSGDLLLFKDKGPLKSVLSLPIKKDK